MSNYVDPAATRPFVIGPCRCPGTPHAQDSADIVVRFGYGERATIRQVGRKGGLEALNMASILHGVKRWTLVLPDGSARPIDAVQVAMLDQPTVERLVSDEGLDAAWEDDPLPNDSGAPSPDGSQESASRTPKTPPRPPSTST